MNAAYAKTKAQLGHMQNVALDLLYAIYLAKGAGACAEAAVKSGVVDSARCEPCEAVQPVIGKICAVCWSRIDGRINHRRAA